MTGCALSLLAASSAAQAGLALPPDSQPPHAYIVEVENRIVASRAAHARRQPASLAKLAAALVVLGAERQQPGLLNAPVEVSARAARADGTRLGLEAGDRVRAGDLLAAMLVRSANDACYALAERVGGTVAAFVGRMNQAAARLGMTSTRFIDPCGLDQRGQHTTAADLLLLAKAALAEPRIVALAEERSIRVETVDRARSFTVPSTNALLDRYDGAFGLKTGYTSRAGACVIATARRGETVAIVVILGGGKDRWSVAVVLLDHAFDQAVKIPRVRDRATIGRPDP